MHFLLLATIGAFVGSLINFCIYRLGYEKSAASPWSRAQENVTRKPTHYIPALGWYLRRSEESELGKRFWLRPLLLELTWIFGLPLFYIWQAVPGLTAGVTAPVGWTEVWFIGHSTLFAFLFVATFIDFDQRIIPDSITVPGTLIALLLAAFYPGFRLPEVFPGIGGAEIRSVDFADGAGLPTWHNTTFGVIIGCMIFLVWILALLPKFPLEHLNLKSLKMVFASTCRFLKKNGLKVRTKARRTGFTYLAIAAIGIPAIVLARYYMPFNWDSLFGALVGLGFGGMTIWLVRIVASHSLGQEAMGFGDVTLMAMIGAFFGWQASLIVFTLSPFAALAIVAVNFLITKENELAFGPYLCLGTVITLIGWNSIWPWALNRFFLMPLLLVVALGFSLIMLMFMMLFVRKMKGL